MADEFRYNPEDEEKNKGTRLPFGLCNRYGIKVEDWWTPRDAWEALQSGGYVKDVSDEYKEFYRKKKREREKARRKERKERRKVVDEQKASPDHSPDEGPSGIGKISGAEKGEPMTFEQADSGNVNPYYKDLSKIGYRHNCQTCVAVYFARRNGYDVRALPNLDNRAIYELSYDTSLAYKDKETGKAPNHITKYPGQSTLKFIDTVTANDGIYTLQYGYVGKRSGHIVIAERSEGKLRLYDPQTNETYDTPEKIKQKLNGTESHKMIDLNKCDLDERFCDKIMKRSKK